MVGAGCAIAPEEIVITSGATEAVNLALLAVTKPGDVIAVESPTYHGFLELLGGLGLRVLPIDSCTVDGISVNALERALRARSVTAVLLIASFTNPLGGVLSVEDRKRIVALASEHDVAIIEDDVYADLAFDGSHLPAIKAYDTEGRVLHCSSFSKTLSPGLRVGWCAPGRHFDEVVRAKHRLNVAAPVGPQLAAARYLTGSGYERHLRRLRRAYAEQVEAMAAQVLASFPEGTRVSQPQGGSVLWVEMPDDCDALRLFRDAEAVGIAIAPGPLFDPSGNYRNCIRLNCASPWSPKTAGAVARLGHLLEEQRQQNTGDTTRARRKPATNFRAG
jgi:DNA-binding transcriptional MocR family regulator